MQDIHGGAIDLNLMVALDALLEDRNVTRAAARVGLTQSAMSHRLRRLRELFDDELLVGGRQGMVPTPRAMALVAPVRRGLLELHAAVRNTTPFDPSTAERRFTIVTSDFADLVILPRVMEYVGRVAPGISMRIQPPSGGSIVQALEHGVADLVMGTGGLEGASLRMRSVCDESFVVILRVGHPILEGRDHITVEEYASLGHVVVAHTDQPGVVDERLAERGLARRTVLRTPYFNGVPFMVARSDLVATIPRAIAEVASNFADLRIVEPPVELPTFRIMATWHERVHRDPAHRWLRELARDMTVQALARDGD
ncbi:MAG: LysR family transcriptional regulator [Myxococcota bacterium]